MYLETDSDLVYIATDYEDFVVSCVSSIEINQLDGAMTDEEMHDNSSDDDEGENRTNTRIPQISRTMRKEESRTSTQTL